MCPVLKPPDVLACCGMHCLGMKAVLHACWPHMPIDTISLTLALVAPTMRRCAVAAFAVKSHFTTNLTNSNPAPADRLTPSSALMGSMVHLRPACSI